MLSSDYTYRIERLGQNETENNDWLGALYLSVSVRLRRFCPHRRICHIHAAIRNIYNIRTGIRVPGTICGYILSRRDIAGNQSGRK